MVEISTGVVVGRVDGPIICCNWDCRPQVEFGKGWGEISRVDLCK